MIKVKVLGLSIILCFSIQFEFYMELFLYTLLLEYCVVWSWNKENDLVFKTKNSKHPYESQELNLNYQRHLTPAIWIKLFIYWSFHRFSTLTVCVCVCVCACVDSFLFLKSLEIHRNGKMCFCFSKKENTQTLGYPYFSWSDQLWMITVLLLCSTGKHIYFFQLKLDFTI